MHCKTTIFCTIILCCFGARLLAQEVVHSTIEQQLENQAEADEGATEDDSYYQQLQQYRRTPINLNTATESDLQPFRFMTDFQIQNFLSYRKLFGPLLSMYELQAIPGWDIDLINRLRIYVYVGSNEPVSKILKERFSAGQHSLLLRAARVVQLANGFFPKDSLPAKYPGSPMRLMMRYKYVYKNLLQFGFLGEKDAGEQFFAGAQNKGFDFYSMHLFVRNLGIIRQLAIGDFSVNLGQGLLTYQSLGFRKSVDVMNIKRQTETIRPYNSPAEFNYMRGAAATLGWGHYKLTLFAARQRLSGSIQPDSLGEADLVSSIINNGLHRTPAEVARRNRIRQTAVGGSFQYRRKALYLAANANHFQLSAPLQKEDEPYNQYAFSGKTLTGLSAEAAYTWRNVHAFGEIAANPGGGRAMLAGLMASLDARVDLSLLYRNMAPNYHSLYGNAFTEGTRPNNEKGLFTGLAFRASRAIRIDAYADFFTFPWVRYRVSRPSKGKDFVVQITWRPNKQLELYSRYRSETKAINYSQTNLAYFATEDVARTNWRTQVQYRLSASTMVRSRVEMMWFDKGKPQAAQGFLLFADFFYNPMMKPFGFNARLQYFETDNFDSRIFAFENDVLYSFTIPAFFYKGYRGYANISYNLSRKTTAWFRFSHTLLPERTSIGSGNDEIAGNRRTDWKIQVLHQF